MFVLSKSMDDGKTWQEIERVRRFGEAVVKLHTLSMEMIREGWEELESSNVSCTFCQDGQKAQIIIEYVGE